MAFLDTGYSEAAAEAPAFELLPDGDYKFRISEAQGIEITDKGQEKLSLILTVDSHRIYCYLYAGDSQKTGKPYDMISPFCRAIGVKPTAKEANNPTYWTRLAGKVGMCHIIQEEQVGGKYSGQLGNKVKYFIYPKDVGATAPTRPEPARQSAGPVGPDLDDSPDDIPFAPCTL